ncbi:MAG TPA: tetratricopeptide repeat protein [Stenotrophobium sp.]|nr:tetratricopeptide repeat protein [Stenotrophobium sp.]
MKRALAMVLGGLLLAGNAEAASWSGLWLTPDQRGERLLQHGDAAAAARTYADPRRKAYAELRAGDYQAAAQGFQKFDDSDAQYNRGNALVHAGELQQALDAYDAALARNPGNHDARHNRDLVAQALKRQKQQQSRKNKSGGSNGKPQSGNDQDQDKNQESGRAGKQGGSDQQNGSSSQKPAEGKKSSAEGQPKSQDQKQQSGSSASPAAEPQSGQQPDAQQQSENAAEQARQDAAESLRNQTAAQKAGQQTAGQARDAGRLQPARGATGTKPLTEQQISQEQWLRRIPDDPGGLLRRKFMIEHMLRQQNPQGQPP